MPRTALTLAALALFTTNGLASAADAAPSHPPAVRLAATKKYQATITRTDERHNTKTFTDYCDAASTAEAQRTFEGRYPNDRVSGVREAD